MGILSTFLESIKSKNNHKKLRALPLAAALVIVATGATQTVSAVDYNAEIQKLQNQNASNESTRRDLQTAALPLEAQITNLRTTIAALDELIGVNEQKRTDLTASIAALSAQIAGEREILKVSIRQLYIESDMSMIEKMASSKNLSDYVEKEQYTIAAQTKVKQGMDKIAQLEGQQRKEKKQTDQLLVDNKKMQTQMSGEKQEVDRLLAMNKAEQDKYASAIANNNSQITDLQRNQAAENARFLQQSAVSGGSYTQLATNILGVDGSSYPWANAPWPNDLPDPWGMYQRQCVSYTAWKVSASGRHMPNWGGRGNANQWDENARAAGIPADSSPRAGDVAVRNAGTYGHVMYVDSVNSDGSINISQYNANWDGRYSEARISPSGLVFIHF
ncbi:MAG: hypothetical protein JWP13_68 [Candidatus Saccharibacteria bacterium]|nr:hypothetical protein [Candidatus Saccharibacteria bacterium]